MLSLQTILMSLQNMLGRENHIKILLSEGLEDFITCSPSYVPESLKPQAKEMVQIMRSGMQLQPPKLVNLAKAKLAKMYFGLESAMNTTVGDLISTVSPPKISQTNLCQRAYLHKWCGDNEMFADIAKFSLQNDVMQ